MARIFDLKFNKGSFMLVLFSILGFGLALENENDEKSFTLTIKLWKLHFFYSIAIL